MNTDAAMFMSGELDFQLVAPVYVTGDGDSRGDDDDRSDPLSTAGPPTGKRVFLDVNHIQKVDPGPRRSL